jgi:hypothetical protein
MRINEKQADRPIYFIMSEQPDCCSKCWGRLELVEIRVIDGEQIFVSECLTCNCEVLLVED